MHRKDVISLNTQELEDVFDNLMDAFVFYQNWEQKMLSAYLNENPEQGIIDACKDIFGPMFFATMSLQVTAFPGSIPGEALTATGMISGRSAPYPSIP